MFKSHSYSFCFGSAGMKLIQFNYFSVFLGKIKEAFDKNPNLSNLLMDGFFTKVMNDNQVLHSITICTVANLLVI